MRAPVPATATAGPHGTTHDVAARLFGRPFAPGAISFGATTRTRLTGAPLVALMANARPSSSD